MESGNSPNKPHWVQKTLVILGTALALGLLPWLVNLIAPK